MKITNIFLEGIFMNKTTFHNGSWVFKDIKLKADKDINIYISHLPESVKEDEINIYVSSIDPEEFRANNKDIIDSAQAFDVILTCDQQIIDACKNAMWFNFGYTFVSKDYKYEPKQFGVNMLTGIKNKTEGHKLRHKIADRLEETHLPAIVYTSLLDKKYKDALFNKKFSIVIENVKRPGYFTEKLIDCLYTKTVPIYWGCPDIDRFFNKDGIVSFDCHTGTYENEFGEKVEYDFMTELLIKLNDITADTYDEMIEAIEDNYNRSLEYIQYNNKLRDRLQAIVDGI
jgi:hypothetical protein